MATKTFEELKQMAIQIRDEKTNKQNTATRIGTQMLEHLNKLEQEYYDKTILDKRTTELNISNLYPTNGVGGTNKYTLAGAIAQVPVQYRVQGLKVTFMNESGGTESWECNSNGWIEKSFNKIGAERLSYSENNICKILGMKVGELKGGLLTETGTAANGSWQYIDFVQIKNGEILYISIEEAPTSPYIPMQIYNTTKEIIENITFNYNGFYIANSDGYIRICGQKNKELSIYKFKDDITGLIENNYNSINTLNDIIMGNLDVDVDFPFQGYINNNGTLTSNINQRTTDYLEYEFLLYSVLFELSTLGAYINFYDREKKHIPQLSENYKANGTYENKLLIKPKTAKYYRITSSNGFDKKAKASQYNIINDINFISERVKNNENNIEKNTQEIEKLKDTSSSDIVKIDIPFEFQGYINAEGKFLGHPNYVTTDFLSYDKINFTLSYGLSGLSCAYINFYDNNFGWLKELSAEYIKDETISNKELKKPQGSTYYRLVAYKESEYSAYFLSENYKKRKTINKNINWIGHSIWWYNGNKLGGNGEVARGYQTLLKEQFNITQTGNYCYSGHSLGGLTAEDENSILEPATIATWQPSENAVWTLDTITNDFKRNIQIGTIDDYNNNTGITTYYGALRVFKDKIAELSGENAIIICSNALRRNNSGYTSTSENTEGHTLEDYELALMTIASKNKWIFVDQFRMCGVTDNSIMTTTIDGLHLNNFGYTLAVIPWIWAFDYVYNKSLLDSIVQPNV